MKTRTFDVLFTRQDCGVTHTFTQPIHDLHESLILLLTLNFLLLPTLRLLVFYADNYLTRSHANQINFSLLQYLSMVLSFSTWLAEHHPEWRNPIIVNAYFAFYAILYLHSQASVEYLESWYPNQHCKVEYCYKKAPTSVEL